MRNISAVARERSVDVEFDLHKVLFWALSGPIVVVEATVLPP